MNARVKPMKGQGKGVTRVSGDALKARYQSASMLTDSLMEALGGIGTDKDKLHNSSFLARELDPAQALIAYRTDWVSRKIVDIPAYDACREWRNWQADSKDITALEDAEEALGIQLKTLQALKKARLFGGAAMVMGVDQGTNEDPLNYDTIKQGDLKFVHVVSRHELGTESMQLDIADPYYGEPTFYTRSSAPVVTVQKPGSKINGLRFHPSRIIPFVGAELQEPNAPTTPWGDSVLQVVYDAVRASALVTQSAAQLMYEAKIDVIRVPGLSENIATKKYEDNLKARFAVANLVKSIYSMLLIDKEEEWQRQNTTFAGIPDLLQMYMMIASGAADIPVTRFLGQSPAGLSATGESDLRNYYDSTKSKQKLEVTPRLKRLDAVLLPSTFGKTPDEIFYEWVPLWQMSDKEKSEIAKSKADTAKIDLDMGLITPMVLKQARQNQLIEDATYPGLEGFIEEFDPDNEDPEAGAVPMDPVTGLPMDPNNPPDPNAPPVPAPANQNDPVKRVPPKKTGTTDTKRVRSKHTGTFDSMRQSVEDATPRTAYVHRKVLNAGAIRDWAKANNFQSMLEDGDLHVTIAYSLARFDWSKIGEAYGEDDNGNLRIKPGGPRMMEQFGEATVLVFSNTELQWRHASICRNGADWEHDDFNPHITISYKWDMAMPIENIKPYQGELILGPEVWEEIDIASNVDNTQYAEQAL
jgi:uncharacterized protein